MTINQLNDTIQECKISEAGVSLQIYTHKKALKNATNEDTIKYHKTCINDYVRSLKEIRQDIYQLTLIKTMKEGC